MAYLDQATGVNRRLITGMAVAVLQAAAIIAIVNGLTVHFIPLEPEKRPEASNIPIPLPPQPPPPEVRPDSQSPVRMRDLVPPVTEAPPRRTLPLPELVPLPTPQPTPFDPPTGFVRPSPLPTPSFAPRGARPRNPPQNWATASDYPTHELREGAQGLVRYALTIGPDGKVTSCLVTLSSGHIGLDQATCRLVSRRARFDAATDDSGSRVSGSYAGSIFWRIPEE